MSDNELLFNLFDSHGRKKKNDYTANAPSKQACVEIYVLFLFVILLSKEVILCAKGTKSGEKVFMRIIKESSLLHNHSLCLLPQSASLHPICFE